ncbi:MAG: LacI family DNA-binding transcriptional regulator [Pseudomonadota bacterium]
MTVQSGKVTIFDVAQHAGVSIKTVSRVINREPNVRQTTRERVQRAVDSLQYRPDQSARNLASQKSHLIALVYDDPAAYELPSSGYIIRMQQGALRACRASMKELLIHPCDFRQRNVASELRSLINDTRLSGLVLAAPLSNMQRIVRAVQATKTPFVRISPGKVVRGQPCVVTNDREVSSHMVDHLVELGHRRIAFIKGDPTHEAVGHRYLGYLDGLARHGITPDERLVADGNNSFDSGQRCAKKLLNRKRRPTAIFCANDDMAAGVIRTANRLGISVPSELSVSGFDDIILARQLDPMLTTIRQPLGRMAEAAVSMLTGNANGERSVFESVPGSLQLRESTGPVDPR